MFDIHLPSLPVEVPGRFARVKKSLPFLGILSEQKSRILRRSLQKSDILFAPCGDRISHPYDSVDLMYWRPLEGVNFGDDLSRVIVELMLARKGMTLSDSTEKRQLLAIGSILHTAFDNAVIWGTGLNGTVPEEYHSYKNLDVRAVRGPITKQYLEAKGITAPSIFGDPGLLLSKLHAGRFNRTSEYPIGIVPHYTDFDAVSHHSSGTKLVINPMRAWNEVVSDIVKCDRVISSSLHGIIIAESFDIPAQIFRISESESVLKYEDYYAGTGRKLNFSSSVQDAVTAEKWIPPKFDADKLMSAFPYDLWY